MKKIFIIIAVVTIHLLSSNAFSLSFTLSDSALMEPEQVFGNAVLLNKRDIVGPGVEYDLLFGGPSNLNSIETRIKVADLDLSSYDHFDLKFTLLAINGDNSNENLEILSAGAMLTGWKSDGTYTGNFNPTTLRLNEGYDPIYDQSFSSSGISSTINASGYTTSYQRIETAGVTFYIAAKFVDSWTFFDDTIVTLLIEPAEGAIVIPEPATLSLLALGAILAERKRIV
jgi:hypothetical protein